MAVGPLADTQWPVPKERKTCQPWFLETARLGAPPEIPRCCRMLWAHLLVSKICIGVDCWCNGNIQSMLPNGNLVCPVIYRSLEVYGFFVNLIVAPEIGGLNSVPGLVYCSAEHSGRTFQGFWVCTRILGAARNYLAFGVSRNFIRYGRTLHFPTGNWGKIQALRHTRS